MPTPSARFCLVPAMWMLLLLFASGGVWSEEARAGTCNWTNDPAIGQPGLTQPPGWALPRDFHLWNGDLLVGGSFTLAGGTPAQNFARWNGSTWSSMGSYGFSSDVWALDEFQGSLYAFGQFRDVGPHTAWRAAKWSGSDWLPLGIDLGLQRPSDLNYGEVRASLVRGDSIIVGGRFTRAGDQPVGLIAAWDGLDWHPLGAGFDTMAVDSSYCDWDISAGVFALAEYNGDIIAGGNFLLTAGGDTMNCIARWDGTSWSALGNGMMGPTGSGPTQCGPGLVNALTVYDGSLIAGGRFQGADGQIMRYVARWDGASWHAMGTGWATDRGGSVQALTVTAGNELIAGGNSNSSTEPGAGHRWQVVRWNGSDWEEFLPDFTMGLSTPQVVALFPWGPDLVVGGSFLSNAAAEAMDFITIARCNAPVSVAPSGVSSRIALRAEGANPFFASTSIAFDLPDEVSSLRLEIHDLAGRSVRMLHDGALRAGGHSRRWDGRGDDGRRVPAGVYFATLKSGEHLESLRMVRLQ